MLDIGCGTGDVACPLAPQVGRVDAVDISPAMIARGRDLPGGDHPRYTTNRDYQPYDMIDELTRRGLFTPAGAQETAPVPFTQSIESYIESIHSRNGFSRDRMPADAAAAFDAGVRALLAPACPEGMVTLQIVGEVCWGRPEPGG